LRRKHGSGGRKGRKRAYFKTCLNPKSHDDSDEDNDDDLHGREHLRMEEGRLIWEKKRVWFAVELYGCLRRLGGLKEERRKKENLEHAVVVEDKQTPPAILSGGQAHRGVEGRPGTALTIWTEQSILSSTCARQKQRDRKVRW
jgi:hypothetical protein